MIGRFLEISVGASNVLAAVNFWEALGFVQLKTGEVRPYHYGVLTDGRMLLGVHGQGLDAPALTWVRPQLEDAVLEISAHATLTASSMGDDEFHELRFEDPDGHLAWVLEARTFSPGHHHEEDFSRLGRFSGYRLPVRDLDRSIAFWEPLGFVAIEVSQGPRPQALLCNDGINLCLDLRPGQPTLMFEHPEIDACVAWLMQEAYPVEIDADGDTVLRSPEGLVIELRGQPT